MQYLEIGQIVNTFGIKGMVKVCLLYTSDAADDYFWV